VTQPSKPRQTAKRHLCELKSLGIQIIDPVPKLLACGDMGNVTRVILPFLSHNNIHFYEMPGVGAMAELDTIVDAVKSLLEEQSTSTTTSIESSHL